MDETHPLVRELFPELIADLIACLEEAGETELAIVAWDVRLYQWCECGDDFCQSFYTAPRPDGAYGPGHRCVPLIPKKGDLILDVVRNRIHRGVVPSRSPRRDEPQYRPGSGPGLSDELSDKGCGQPWTSVDHRGLNPQVSRNEGRDATLILIASGRTISDYTGAVRPP
ncbi:hypothetical protein [Microbispora rosea]|uniref:hypothetical protein n=1 Tax=Microbispora rosea TaxID=58117 RepID=UPI0018CC24BA|nr:hypothetical protein [Microbispora rosea]